MDEERSGGAQNNSRQYSQSFESGNGKSKTYLQKEGIFFFFCTSRHETNT
jgi:hypothetical protein